MRVEYALLGAERGVLTVSLYALDDRWHLELCRHCYCARDGGCRCYAYSIPFPSLKAHAETAADMLGADVRPKRHDHTSRISSFGIDVQLMPMLRLRDDVMSPATATRRYRRCA